MAKKLFSGAGREPDRRLLEEVNRLRAMTQALEFEITRLRADNDRLSASASEADDLLRWQASEYSRSEEGRGGVAVATGGKYRSSSAGGVADQPSLEPSAERIDRLEDSLLHLGSLVDNLVKSQERRPAEVAADRMDGLERSVNRLASLIEDLDQGRAPDDEPPGAADNQALGDVLEVLARHRASTPRPGLRSLVALIGAGSLFDLAGRATSETLLESYNQARGYGMVEQ